MARETTTTRIPVASFAPPLTDESLARYEELANEQEGELLDALTTLLACVKTWWELPESTRKDVTRWQSNYVVPNPDYDPLASKLTKQGQKNKLVPFTFEETPLEESHIEALDSVTPWMRELDTLSTPQDTGPFDSLPSGELRNAAFHLLWFAKELTLDREPLTKDKLPPIS